MHFHNAAIAVLAGVAPLLARADDLELDRDDIPQQCVGICEPVRRLTQICDVDDDRIRNDRVEDLLNVQCVCTNRSFDVGRFAALCQSCMTQNARERSDLEDINKIMRQCGFASQNYSPSQSNDANSVSVSAVRPTDANQLTTTFAPGGPTSAPSPTGTGTRAGGGNSQPPATPGATTPAGGNGNSNSNPSPPSAASATLPALGLALAAVVGSMLLL